MQVKFTNITSSPNDIVVTPPFHVEIGSLVEEFYICIPFSMIEPLQELLANPPLENLRLEDQSWRENLVRQVQHSELELVANFTDVSLRLSEILKLAPGDVLNIENPSISPPMSMACRCSPASRRPGWLVCALCVDQLINPVLNSQNEESLND